MTEILTQSTQDYLKQIYRLSRASGSASTQELADALNVAPASVTGMMRRLASSSPPLVVYNRYQGVSLTPDGERAALEVIRHHRLLEAYLVDVLGYGWEDVHEEACRLEHVISEDFEMRIDEVLGNPRRDPHGELIPGPDLSMPADASIPLADLRPGAMASVQRVASHDPLLLRRLEQAGLKPGVALRVEAFSEIDCNLTVWISGQPAPQVLGLAITSQVFVELMEEKAATK